MSSKRERRRAHGATRPDPKTTGPESAGPQVQTFDPREDLTDDQLPFLTVTNMTNGMGAVIEGMERMMLPKLREVIYTEPILVVSVVCRCGINQGATYQTSPDEIYALLTHAVHCVGGES